MGRGRGEKPGGRQALRIQFNGFIFLGRQLEERATERHRAKTIVEFWLVLVFSGDYFI